MRIGLVVLLHIHLCQLYRSLFLILRRSLRLLSLMSAIWQHFDLITVAQYLTLRLPNHLMVSCIWLCIISRCFPIIFCSDFTLCSSLVCIALKIGWIHKRLPLLRDTIFHFIGSLLLQPLTLFRILSMPVKGGEAARLRHREHPDVKLIMEVAANLVVLL